MKQFDTIIFDLGGVLIDWKPEYVYRTIFKTEAEVQWFLHNITTGDWNEEQDAGKSLALATEELVAKFPEQEANIRAFYGRWEEMLGGPIEGTVEVFRELRNSTANKIYALTNWSAETFPIALQKYDFLHWFDGRLVSGEEKTRKPFMDIYEKLIERFSINPQSSIYIDDNKRNLYPAQELGMHIIHFQSPEQLREELKSLAVL
ncbi:MAG: HAD family phosphatase [Sphingobacteriales bacterium]|nr:MAG: HAD family phosphatase [Sphingobacteriales bacterium]